MTVGYYCYYHLAFIVFKTILIIQIYFYDLWKSEDPDNAPLDQFAYKISSGPLGLRDCEC